MDALMIKLSEQQAVFDRQLKKQDAIPSADVGKAARSQTLRRSDSSSQNADLMTPVTTSSDEALNNSADKEDVTIQPNVAEMERLKKELDAANDQIARQKQELDQSRIMKHTLNQAMGSSMDTEPTSYGAALEDSARPRQATLSPSARSGNHPHDVHWDTRSAMSDTASMDNYNSNQNVWQSSRAFGNANFNPGLLNQPCQASGPTWASSGNRPWGGRAVPNAATQMIVPQQQQMLLQQRTFSGPASPLPSADFNQYQAGPLPRRPNTQTRAASLYPPARDNVWDAYGNGIGSLDGMTMAMNTIGGGPYQGPGMYSAPMPYQPRPIGTPLSPTAAEFRTGSSSTNPWNTAVS